MSNNYYDILWVDKNSSEAEIKKAYRKKAMEFHPDRNSGDITAEKKFKEVNSAYDTLGDKQKKQQYDTFGSTWWSGWNPFGWWWAGWWFEDMFSNMWWSSRSQSQSFNFDDLFWWWAGWWFGWQSKQSQEQKKPISLDFEKIYEVPIFDLILGCKIEVKWVYWNTAKLKIPASTKSGTKFRVKWFWKKEPGREWNLIVKVEWIMPKNISEVDLHMLESIRDNIGY